MIVISLSGKVGRRIPGTYIGSLGKDVDDGNGYKVMFAECDLNNDTAVKVLTDVLIHAGWTNRVKIRIVSGELDGVFVPGEEMTEGTSSLSSSQVIFLRHWLIHAKKLNAEAIARETIAEGNEYGFRCPSCGDKLIVDSCNDQTK